MGAIKVNFFLYEIRSVKWKLLVWLEGVNIFTGQRSAGVFFFFFFFVFTLFWGKNRRPAAVTGREKLHAEGGVSVAKSFLAIFFMADQQKK